MEIKKIAILTSGGDCSGMNVVIRAVIKSAQYYNLDIDLVKNGYQGILDEDIVNINDFKYEGNLLNRGGTILGTSRCIEFKNKNIREKAIEILKKHNIDALITLGGDGTFMGAKLLTEEGIPCIGIPCTIDNDIPSTDESIGFNTCVQKVIDAIESIRDTSFSHKRCCIVETMGRYCGNIAIFAGIATGCDIWALPTTKHKTEQEIIEYASKILLNRVKNNKRFTIFIITENLYNIFKVAEKIGNKTNIVTKASRLGYLQRGGSPVFRDRLIGTRMGIKAVELLIKEINGVCIGIKNNKIIHTDIYKSTKIPENQYNDVIEDWKKVTLKKGKNE